MPKTLNLTHSFVADGRQRGRTWTQVRLARTDTFAVPELDARDAPLALTLVRPLPDGRTQEVAYRVHDGRYLRRMVDHDDVTPLDPARFAFDVHGDGRASWSDHPANWADGIAPYWGSSREALRLTETNPDHEMTARGVMAANVASLLVIDGHLWAPSHPPLWVAEGRMEPVLNLLVPGLDDGRVRDLASFAETGGRLYHSDTPARCLPWTVPAADASRILGCVGDTPAVTFQRHDWDLPEGGCEAYRAFLLADDLDSALSHALWERMDPFARMTLARASGEARLAVGGHMDPRDVLDRAGADLAACAARYRAKGLYGTWSLMDHVVDRSEAWSATRLAEVAWRAERFDAIMGEPDEDLADVDLMRP